MSDLGSFVTVWEDDGSSYTVIVEEEPRIDAAVSEHIASGHSRDSLLDLEMTDGRQFKVRASHIVSWAISTPQTRRRALEVEAEQKSETENFKKELGVWEQE